jgi:site-specific recombinase XerD
MTQETLVGGEENAESEAFDPISLIEPVNVMDKLPKHLYENLVYNLSLTLQADQKWKVRKEALENLLQILNVPKYADGKYGELVSSLGKVCCLSN